MADETLTQDQLEKVASAAGDVAAAASAVTSPAPRASMEMLLDVNLHVIVEVGKAKMTVQDLLQLGQGSVVELEKLAGEPLDIYINGKHVARGEAVIVNEKFGVRVTELIQHEPRSMSL
jgi:flagellar motor switch protein FliN/FliY